MSAARKQIAEVLNGEGAFCGVCGREPGDPIGDCPECAQCLYGYADALVPLMDRLRTEAAAEALESAAAYWDRPNLRAVAADLRERAINLRAKAGV